jgi:hypothetical protein
MTVESGFIDLRVLFITNIAVMLLYLFPQDTSAAWAALSRKIKRFRVLHVVRKRKRPARKYWVIDLRDRG